MNIKLILGGEILWQCSILRYLSILFFVYIVMLMTISPVTQVMDSDGDGLADDLEIKYHTDPSDADSDDDGVLDGDEIDWNKNSDGIGEINALDHDSDNDGIFDGTEKGVTVDDLTNDTDLSKGHFIEDQDPNTNTSMIHKDTDSDRLNDGEEDKNRNGRIDVDLSETDPNFPDRDGDGTADQNDDDIDGDGMSNDFEYLFDILDLYDPTDAILDDDLDGFSNLREFYGDDNSPFGSDWSEPNNHMSTPDMPPGVKFLVSKIEGIEANQTITFDNTLFSVTDSERDWEQGLKFTWNWGDGNKDVEIVYNSIDYSIIHKYTGKGDYTVTLSVEDNFDHPPVSDSTEMFILEPPVPKKEDKTVPPSDGPIGESTDEKSVGILASFFWIILIIIVLILVVIAIVAYFSITNKNESRFQPYLYQPSPNEYRVKPVDYERPDRFVAPRSDYQQYQQQYQNPQYPNDTRYPPPY